MARRSSLTKTAWCSILCGLCLCLCLSFSGINLARAQTTVASAPTTQPAAAHKPHTRKKRRKAHRVAKAALPAKPAPVAPPPEPPKPAAPAWPIPPEQQPAVQATVTFSGDQLTIVAKNSSLQAILQAVSQQTGLKVTGLDGDMRIFGTYGPGTVSQTLNALLQGSQYNYVLVGGDATHPPKELDFSLSH